MKYRILILLLLLIVSLLCSCTEPQHTHGFAPEYTNDETHHWYACECGEKNGYAEHEWNNGIVTLEPTEESNGIKTFTCLECGRKKTEIIPATAPVVKGGGMTFAKSTHYRISEKLAKTPLTLEAEIYVDSSITGRAGVIFGNYYGIRQNWLLEIHENGVPRFYYSDAAGNIKDIKFNNVDVRTGDWVHIAFTFDFANKTMTFYMNGQVAQTLQCEADLAEDITRYQFVLGGDNRSDNGMYFRGSIKSLAAYSDVRTATEIADSAKNGINSYADDILVHYVLNENSEGNEIKDLSENGYDIPKEWIDSHEPTLDYAYSFAVVGDTQWLSKYTPEKMSAIYDWIIANKDSKKIAHVFGLGDITEDWNTAGKESEWMQAQQYIYKLNGVLPYSLIRGNHDESKYFNKYFATDAYINQFGGHFMVEGDIRNSYKEIVIGSTKYLLLTLDYGASDEMLEWANGVVLAHPDHRVIVTTHGYQGFDGGHLSYDNTPSSGDITAASDVDTSVGDNSGRGYNNGKQMWEKFVSKHPNIFLVLSGHTPFEDVMLLQTEGVHGNVVNQMVIDPQWMDPQKGGVGMVAMLYFSADGKQVEVEWISTDTGKYYKEQNQFVLDLEDSLNAPAHEFYDSYNSDYHYKACDCGYTYGAEAHIFDGGVPDGNGFMIYSCDCGYQRKASASSDPIALELQELLDKYYNDGVYYKETFVGTEPAAATFYNGNKLWTLDASDYKNTADYLTLYDLYMGKCGDLRLDLGWNVLNGVYSSSNDSTIKGVRMFALSLGVNDTSSSDITKVTVAEAPYHLIITLWAGDSVYATTEVGLYATVTLVNHAGETFGEIYVQSDDTGLCEVTAPTLSGYVAEYDKLVLSTAHDELTKTIYYSELDVWDGTSVSTSLSGSGTKEDPFLVQSGADLAYIRDVVNAAAAKAPNFSGKYFKMTQSIDLNGANFFIGDYKGWNDRKGFHGFFDGNHCTVRGLNSESALFGTIEGGWFKNLSVYGNVTGTHDTVAGAVAYVYSGGIVENVTNYVTVTGIATVGGVVANAENQNTTVIDCVNYGNVTGSSYIIGGITGSGGHDIKNCVNYGNITSTANDCVGGIAGSTKNTGSITNCYNYGTIKARGKVGGIAGQANKPVTGCVNYGDVNGTWAMGGIVGYVKGSDSVTITDCVNNGTVTASSTGIGGILGILEGGAGVTGKAIVKNCVNNGGVSGSWGVGGVVGDALGEITGCVNNGTVSAKGDLGGIIGKAYGKITECTNNGAINGTEVNVGGIVGRLHVATHLDVINTTNENNGELNAPNPQEIIGTVE